MTYLTQRWPFEENWSIKRKGEYEVLLPAGKSYFIAARESKTIILPWLIQGKFFSIFNSCSIRELLTAYTFSPVSGEIRVNIFNCASRTVVVAARSFLICVRSLGKLDIRHLHAKKNRKEIKSQHLLTEGISFSDITDSKYWESRFPLVFSEPDGKGPTPAMERLAITLKDVRLKTPLHSDFGMDFTVDHLAPKEWIDEAFDKYLKAGFFAEVPEGKWVYKNPSLFIPKAGRKQIRWLHDLRQLNSHFALPRSDFMSVREVIRRIPTNWHYFAVVDIADGFFSLPLHPDLYKFFGFNYGDRIFEWRVLPQGFVASPGLFHQRLAYILKNHDAINYMDDVILGSNSVEGLKESLDKLFELFTEYGLRIQKKKLRFGNGSIEYLGFDVLSGGRVTCSSYLRSKKDLIGRDISCVRDLQSIIGVFNTIRKYVPRFSQVISELQEFVTCKGPFPSEKVMPLVIKIWNEIFVSFQICHLPDEHIESWHLYTDWSEGQLGYCLFFKSGEDFKLCDMNSCIKKEARSVSSFLGELMGIKYALNSVRHLLSSAPLSVYCDNNGVVTKLNHFIDDFSDIRVSRLVSWLFSNFPAIHLFYFPGGLNKIADGLSRLPATSSPMLSNALEICLTSHQLEGIRKAHAGHFSMKTTYRNLLLDGYRWPSMWQDTMHFCRNCQRCQLFKRIEHTPAWGNLCGAFPFDLVYIDFAGPLKWSDTGKRFFICVLVDSFSKFMVTRTSNGCTAYDALSTVKLLIDNYGTPHRIQSDQGAAFISDIFRQYLRELKIKQQFSVASFPQSNGIVERAIGNLKQRLKRNKSRGTNNQRVGLATSQINHTVHNITLVPPISVALGIRRNGEEIPTEEYSDLLSEVAERIAASHQRTQRTQLQKYHQHEGFQIGDSVMFRNMDPGKRWNEEDWVGPFKVVTKYSDHRFSIREEKNARVIRPVHSHQLRRFYRD